MPGTPPESRAAYAVVPERHQDSQELLHIGEQCSATNVHCGVVDFLPFKCDHCAKRFCADHRTPEAHACEKWDASAVDRRALECPMCSTLIAVPPGEDPNARFERHFNTDCEVMTGKAPKKSTTPKCARARCGKLLWQPFSCEKCHKQYCATHRYPAQHTCAPASSSTSTSTSTPAQSSHAAAFANFSNQTSVRSAAAMAAVKRSFASVSTPSSSAGPPPASAPGIIASTSNASAGSSTSKPKVPFSSKDRRAISERKSQLRALEERQRKGLLSEADQQRMKELQGSMKEEKECIIM